MNTAKLRLTFGCWLMRTGRRIMPKYERDCVDQIINLGVVAANTIMQQQPQEIKVPAELTPIPEPGPSCIVDRPPTQEEMDELFSAGRSLAEAIAYWGYTHRVRIH